MTEAAYRRLARRVPFARRVYRALRPPSFDELAFIRPLLPVGTMVDVGAHVGGSLEPFAQAGWRVIALEPDPANRAQLVERHGRRANVSIDPRAIGERDGERLTLYASDVSSGISTLTPFHESHHAAAVVETVRLSTLLASVDDVTLLKTDTEGWDLPVLRTFPWDRLHPAAVVCEFEDRKTRPLGYGFDDLAGFLVERGYVVSVSEWFPIVEYGRAHRWRSLWRYPGRLSVPTAWGNLIAVTPELAPRIASPEPRSPLLLLVPYVIGMLAVSLVLAWLVGR